MSEIPSSPPPPPPPPPAPPPAAAAPPASPPPAAAGPGPAPQASGPADSFAPPAARGPRNGGDTFEASPAAPTQQSGPVRGQPSHAVVPELPAGLPPDNYSPNRPGWHNYEVTNVVATADQRVSPEQMRDYLLRHAVPGQDPSRPVTDGQTSTVSDPRLLGRTAQNSRWLGTGESDRVQTHVSADGLSISNTTLPGHALHDGRIIRTATQQPDGSWTITTRGYGNNDGQFLGNNWFGRQTAAPEVAARLNEWQGPQIFTAVDQAMAANIQAHSGR